MHHTRGAPFFGLLAFVILVGCNETAEPSAADAVEARRSSCSSNQPTSDAGGAADAGGVVDSGAEPDATPSQDAGAPGSAFFRDGWESAAPGCDEARLTDHATWDEYGPASTCSAPIARVVNDEKHTGASALRIDFAPDGSLNGPDFRIVKNFGTNHSEIYARWWVKWSSNWVWASADHKVAIFGSGSQVTQDVYFNLRGNGSGGPSARVAIGVTPSDTVLSDPSVDVTPGVWHLCELHVVSGVHGRVEAKLDGRLLSLVHEAGNPSSAQDLNTGAGVGFIKLDTTYNAYAYPSSLGLTMQAFYDDVAVGTEGWLGGS